MCTDLAVIRHDSLEDERRADAKLEREIRQDRARRGLLQQPAKPSKHQIVLTGRSLQRFLDDANGTVHIVALVILSWLVIFIR